MRLLKPILASYLFCLAVGCGGDANNNDIPTIDLDSGTSDFGSTDAGDDTTDMDERITPDGGQIVGECGDLAEGTGRCTTAGEMQVCESGNLIAYVCVEGAICLDDPGSAEGVGCFCDDVADGICPDAVCTADPDCAPDDVACEGAETSYPGNLLGTTAFIGNPTKPDSHFLSLYGDLNAADPPDRLGIVAFYRFGVEVGTFDVWDGNQTWIVTLRPDFTEVVALNPPRLELQSGTLVISSVTDRMVGSLTDAVFVDPDTPGCSARVDRVDFDAPIESR